jgi:hypothetical protein
MWVDIISRKMDWSDSTSLAIKHLKYFFSKNTRAGKIREYLTNGEFSSRISLFDF